MINEHVDKEDTVVAYNDEQHKYWIKGSDQTCISVTTLIEKYGQPFDVEFWSGAKALEALLGDNFNEIKEELYRAKKILPQFLKLYNISPEQFAAQKQIILDAWKKTNQDACERGTAIHKMHEDAALGGTAQAVQEFGNGGEFKAVTTNKIEFGKTAAYPEVLLHYISDDNKLRLAGQADLVLVQGDEVIVLDYKGLDVTTPILTTEGFKAMLDIKEGDYVFDKNGNPTKVLHASEIHHNPCYKITFDNGDTVIADHEHRWEIYTKGNKKKYSVVTTEQLKEYLDKYKKTRNLNYLPKIELSKNINGEKKDYGIDPYVLGAWLGDGSKTCGIITNLSTDFWNEIQNRGYQLSENLSHDGKHAEMRTVYGLRTQLHKLGLLNNKHIPEMFFMADFDTKLDLLRGMMDTDGYFNKTRKRFVINTGQLWQAEDFAKLLASMGIKPTIIKTYATCEGKRFDAYNLTFTCNVNPFLTRNKDCKSLPKTNKSTFRNVKSVELVETVPTKCLEVDSETHTFLCGYNLIVTHNTNREIKKTSYFNKSTKKHTMMKYPLGHLMDCNYWHYAMQLSTYAWMIQQIDPKFKIKSMNLIHYDHNGKRTIYPVPYLKKEVEAMLKDYKHSQETRVLYDKIKPIVY